MSDDFEQIREALRLCNERRNGANLRILDWPDFKKTNKALARIETKLREAEARVAHLEGALRKAARTRLVPPLRGRLEHHGRGVDRKQWDAAEARVAHLEGALRGICALDTGTTESRAFTIAANALTASPTMTEVEAHVERMMENPDFREALNDDSPVEGRPAEEVLAPYLAPTMTPATCPTCGKLKEDIDEPGSPICPDPFHALQEDSDE